MEVRQVDVPCKSISRVDDNFVAGFCGLRCAGDLGGVGHVNRGGGEGARGEEDGGDDVSHADMIRDRERCGDGGMRGQFAALYEEMIMAIGLFKSLWGMTGTLEPQLE